MCDCKFFTYERLSYQEDGHGGEDQCLNSQNKRVVDSKKEIDKIDWFFKTTFNFDKKHYDYDFVRKCFEDYLNMF